MRVIIPGGTGLIGRALAPELLLAGHEVIVLSRSPEQVDGMPQDVRVQRWDAKSPEGWIDLLDRPCAIVNLAGENVGSGRWTQVRKQRILQSRLDAGRAVCQAISAAQVRPPLVVQASGIGYYGSHRDEVISEETPPGSDWLASVAIQWEKSTEPVQAMGVRRVVLRIGTVLSTTGGALPRLILPFRLFVGGPIGDGRQWMSWVHLDDVVGAMRFAIEQGDLAGPLNVCAPTPMRNKEIADLLGRVLRRPAFFPVPAFALQLALGEMATLVLDGQRVLPERLVKAAYPFRFASAETALRSLLLGPPNERVQ